MSKNSCFRGCFNKQYGKRARIQLKSSSQRPDHIHWWLARKLCSKNSLLLTCQILGLLVNTFATDKKYPVLNTDNSTIPIQMILSEKQRSCSQIFAALLKSISKFEPSEKKDDPHGVCIFEVTDSENVVR